jgi:hypothetical protein
MVHMLLKLSRSEGVEELLSLLQEKHMNHQLLTVIDALGVKAVNGQLFVFQQFFNLIPRSEGVEELLSLLQEMEGIRSVETKSN